MESYLLVFARITLLIVFFTSAFGKLLDFSSFLKAIDGFQILPRSMQRIAGIIFAVAELLVCLFLLLGGTWLVFAFILGLILLMVFSFALISVLRRGLATSCNCFGSSEHHVSWHDVIRNIVFTAIAAGGLWLIQTKALEAITIRLLETTLLSAIATVFVVVSLNIREILKVFKN